MRTQTCKNSDDGEMWYPESHSVHGSRDSRGIELSADAQELARVVLARRLGQLPADGLYDWEEQLWFRALVWNHRHAIDYAGPHQHPHPPEQLGTTPREYALYLRMSRTEPYAVEVATPCRARALAEQHVIHVPTTTR